MHVGPCEAEEEDKGAKKHKKQRSKTAVAKRNAGSLGFWVWCYMLVRGFHAK